MGAYNDIVADLYVVIGGVRISVAEAMMKDGYALPDSKQWLWGWRIPRPR